MPRTIALGPLTSQEREALREVCRTPASHWEYMRTQAVVLKASGWETIRIAEAFNVSRQAVCGWIRRFQAEGPEGLRDKRKPGRPRVYGKAFRKQLRRHVEKSPRRCGMAFTVWSVLTLASSLFQRTRREVSPSHLRRLLHEEGYRWRRPKLTLEHRQDRRHYRAVQRKLQALEEQASQPGADFVLMYADESEFHLNPGLIGMWTPAGQQPVVPSAGQNRKAIVFGGINYATGRMVWHLAEKKNQWEFGHFLRAVLSQYRKRKVILVLDNVNYHKTKAVQAFLEEHAGRIEILWLPTYSPALNRIERVWRHLKSKYVYNEFFGTKKGLFRAVEQALSLLNDDLHLARGCLAGTAPYSNAA